MPIFLRFPVILPHHAIPEVSLPRDDVPTTLVISGVSKNLQERPAPAFEFVPPPTALYFPSDVIKVLSPHFTGSTSTEVGISGVGWHMWAW